MQCKQPHAPSSIKCAKYEPCSLTNSIVSRRWWIWRAGTWLCFSPTGATHNSTRRTASKLVLVTPAWWCSSARNGSCWLSICGRFWPLVFAAAGIFHDPCEWEFSCVSCSRSSCCYYNVWIYIYIYIYPWHRIKLNHNYDSKTINLRKFNRAFISKYIMIVVS